MMFLTKKEKRILSPSHISIIKVNVVPVNFHFFWAFLWFNLIYDMNFVQYIIKQKTNPNHNACLQIWCDPLSFILLSHALLANTARKHKRPVSHPLQFSLWASALSRPRATTVCFSDGRPSSRPPPLSSPSLLKGSSKTAGRDPLGARPISAAVRVCPS